MGRERFIADVDAGPGRRTLWQAKLPQRPSTAPVLLERGGYLFSLGSVSNSTDPGVG